MPHPRERLSASTRLQHHRTGAGESLAPPLVRMNPPGPHGQHAVECRPGRDLAFSGGPNDVPGHGRNMDHEELFRRLAVALAIGLLIGLERGWQTRDERDHLRTAGFRTFALKVCWAAFAA